uniref:C-type lectin domain-containing protein n=1 Tax=Trichobilharzia regenti TaxID=157069 RepID=A0AA85JFZ9_TRIRE|nr:unnamed protein product [Trichobilharzia regenti]
MLRCFHCSVLVAVFLLPFIESIRDKVKCDQSLGENACLHYFSHPKTFKEAQSECLNSGLSLLTVLTKKQQELLRDFQTDFKDPKNPVWIGLYIEESRLLWASGYPSVPQIFISNQPKLFEGCAVSNISSGDISTWEFIPCDTKLSFVCGHIPKISYRYPFTSPNSLYCPPGYKLFDKNCYLLNEDPTRRLTWEEANKWCGTLDPPASLATIASPMEQDALSVIIAHSPHPVWIGMFLSQDERKWVTGVAVNFTNWYPNQIHGSDKRLCTMMYQRPSHLGQWEEVDCSLQLNYVCQVAAKPKGLSSSTLHTSSILTQGACKSSYYEYNHRCYQLYLGENEKIGSCGVKLSPYSSDESAFMRLLLQTTPDLSIDRAWTGVSLVFDINSKSKWEYKTENNDVFYEAMVHNFYNWSYIKTLSSSPTQESRLCVSLNRDNAVMDVLNCSLKLPSICGYSLPGFKPTNILENDVSSLSTCPNQWIQFSNKCFSPIRSPALTWSSAELDCQNSTDVGPVGKAHLVSIHSPLEQTFISNLFSGFDIWIGLRLGQELTHERSQLWNKSSLYWADESSVNYLSFAPGEPSRHLSNGLIESCFISRGREHDWNDVSCLSRHLYLCQLSLKAPPSFKPTDSHIPAIGDKESCTTISNMRYCIRFISTVATFFKADYECRSYNMSLATISSEEHQKFVMNNLKQMLGGHRDISQVYIGLFTSQDNILWISGYGAVPVAYWQPKFHDVSKNCTYIDTKVDGLQTWGTTDCARPLPYLCSSILTPKDTLSTGEIYKNISFLNCPKEFTLISGSCFMVNTNANGVLDWEAANKACQRIHPGAHLASVLSNEQQDGLTVLMGGRSISAWIGLHSHRNVHKWITGSNVLFTNWKPTEPNTDGTSCTIMHSEADSIGKWSDEPCQKKFGYICETTAIHTEHKENVSQLLGILEQGACESGFYLHDNSCYSLISTQDLLRSPVNFRDDISGRCLLSTHFTGAQCFSRPEISGTIYCPVIATPHGELEASFMRILARTFSSSDSVWIGLKLNRTYSSSHLLSEDGSLHDTSSLMDFDGLFQYQGRQNQQFLYDCFTMPTHGGNLIRMKSCSSHLPAICTYTLKSKVSPVNVKHTADLPPCPTGWISFKDNCYWLPFPLVRLGWSEAERTCQSQGSLLPSESPILAHLASIHSSEEAQFLTSLSLSLSFWTGLKLYMSSDNPLSSTVSLAWSDKSPFDYSAFQSPASTIQQNGSTSPNLLSHLENLENCIAVSGEHNYWDIENCIEDKSFICQLPKTALLPSTVKMPTGDKVSVTTTSPSTPAGSVTCSNKLFPIASKIGPFCYSLVHGQAVDWSNAELSCRNMDPNAHLISIHSAFHLDEVTKILRQNSPQTERGTWIGLHESNFAYKWSDQSDVNYIPISADISKEKRHYLQDCFALFPDSNSSMNWKAVSCNTPSLGFLCRLSTHPSTPSQTTVHVQPSPIKCPSGFRFYRDRCFQLVSNRFTWSEANDHCQHILKSNRDFSGSLARIDNDFDQQFLASLLDNLDPDASAVWIGLYRNLSHDAHSYSWSDGVKPQFIKPILRDHQFPVYSHATRMELTKSINIKSMKLCTSMLRSTDPRLNGIWLQWSCDEPIYLSSICQAWPIHTNIYSNRKSLIPFKTESFYCPPNFHLGTTGLSSTNPMMTKASIKLSEPMCYRVLSNTVKADWESSNKACRNLSTPTYNVSLISIASVFEASFIRAWLNQPRELNGGDLPPNEAVWTALKVPSICPGCYANWTWETFDNETVRYTDWIKPPNGNPGGCYLFHPSPYDKTNSQLGSIQPSVSCGKHYFAVCQTLALLETSKASHSDGASLITRRQHQNARPDCFQPNILMSKFQHKISYETNMQHSVTSKPCLRWDLIDHNLTEVSLNSNLMRNHLLAAEMVQGGAYFSYAENYCSHVFDESTELTKFGCYVSIYPPVFENCTPIECLHPAHVPKTHVHLFNGIVLFIFITTFCVFIAFLYWRLGLRKCMNMRQRYQPFGRHRTSRKRMTTLYFGNPNNSTTGILSNDNHNNTTANNDDLPEDFLSSTPDKLSPAQKSDKPNFISLQTTGPRKLNDTDKSTTSSDKFTLSALSLSRTAASIGFMNPIYVPLNDGYVEDNYDPEPTS